jgi:transaldolase/glucose-6-phosphate isomerase
VLAVLEQSGISLDAITAELVKDGVKLFADAADKLYGAVAHKRATVLGAGIDRQALALGSDIGKAVETATEEWRASAKIRRLWQHDKSVWTGTDEHKWLGWLNSPAAADIADYEDFAQRVKGQKFTDAVVLGMGGSSLGPEVLAETFARKPGFPKLHVLDSTDPAQVRALEKSVDIARTLFIVSSKSGGTTEPNVMKDYFFARVSEAIGADKAGHRFIAVTDPGSSLEKVATKQGFARIFHGDPSIGGRYSVLSPFGLVPAAAAGIDLRTLLKHTLSMVRSCGPDVPPPENPGVQLGLAMGLAGLEGRDKVTILSSEKIADFGAWAEQLIAESTGKDGKGLIPIDGEPLGEPAVYGKDRFFIDLRTEGENDAAHDHMLASLEKAGHPVVRIVMKSVEHIGQEFFRFELATAVAGAVLGINPFNQPDVEDAKIKTRELTAAFEKTGALPPEQPAMSTAQADIYTDDHNAAALRKAGADGDLGSWLKAHLARVGEDDYVALLAYIERNSAHIDALQHMRLEVRDKRHVATCAEFGPRFLHSTGQAYKGGPDSGVFLQITADDAEDLPVPGQKASFGIIKAAQARGDFDVLTERGRRALRVHLKGDLESGLKMLDTAIANALN